MGKPFAKEFREDVVRVARDRGPGVTLEQIATDSGVHPITLSKWLRRADVEDGVKPGPASDQLVELRELDHPPARYFEQIYTNAGVDRPKRLRSLGPR